MQGSAKGAPGLRGSPLSTKLACAAGCVARVQALFVIDHRGYFGSRSIFSDLAQLQLPDLY